MTTPTTTAPTYRTTQSPVGTLTVAGRGGTVMRLAMEYEAHPAANRGEWVHDPTSFDDVVGQLDEYFAGERTAFDVDLDLQGTPFQQEVWAALQEIPYGETWSYGKLAAHIGRPGASRAVGLANGRNPVGIIVPCHRVIGADGSLTGYGGGIERKAELLAMERERAEPRLL